MKGFTLTELLLSLVVVVLLTLLLIPRIVASREKAQMNEMVSRARSIYIALFSKGDMLPWRETVQKSRFAEARSSDFPTSTALFSEMVSSGFFRPGYYWFSGMGVPACTSANPAAFTAANNAWCVVSDTHSMMDSRTPYLFTRNVSLSSVGPSRRATLTSDAPMGKRHWIFVERSGNTCIASGDSVESWHTGCDTNLVLRP